MSCDDGNSCTSDTCDPTTGCTFTPIAGCGEGCRTTGGGKQPSANTFPKVDFVTHGGQVGAPFGAAGAPVCDSDAGFNNQCIRGEYQHVRHGGGGFHAASNGSEHDFDSLMCACLPCTWTDQPSPFSGLRPADRIYAFENDLIDGLCNPGDRVCGPEPRKAPANKIAFSGVGSWTPAHGKKDQRVIFRVEIEDHSEPGGAHPGGSKLPPDRYRMRMWQLLDADENSPANKQLRATVAIKNPLTEVVPATIDCTGTPTPAPFIDDGGDLDRGNRQLHPTTGATCD
jgi:hypothetical protein